MLLLRRLKGFKVKQDILIMVIIHRAGPYIQHLIMVQLYYRKKQEIILTGMIKQAAKLFNTCYMLGRLFSSSFFSFFSGSVGKLEPIWMSKS